MPFVALDRHTQKRICILNFDEPKEQIDKDALACQECGDSLYIKAGEIMRPHFCHYSNLDITCKSRGESAEHVNAKLYVRDFLQDLYPGATIELEVANKVAGRITDVLITNECGQQIAHEIQLSGITFGDLKERTLSYKHLGIECVWWLGHKSQGATNEMFCNESQGYFYKLYFKRDNIEHSYHFAINVSDLSKYLKENDLQVTQCYWTAPKWPAEFVVNVIPLQERPL